MKYLFVEKNINYSGKELKSLYTYIHHKLHGDSIVSFIGQCDVGLEHMVDAEDFVVNAKIQAESMLHFIVEIFGQNLVTAVSLQRILVSIAHDMLSEKGEKLHRDGDDLYLGDKKLSVSIASCSAVSAMIHLGINITNEGTPVKTCSLQDFAIDPVVFSNDLMKRFADEYKSIIVATQKVKPLD